MAHGYVRQTHWVITVPRPPHQSGLLREAPPRWSVFEAVKARPSAAISTVSWRIYPECRCTCERGRRHFHSHRMPKSRKLASPERRPAIYRRNPRMSHIPSGRPKALPFLSPSARHPTSLGRSSLRNADSSFDQGRGASRGGGRRSAREQPSRENVQFSRQSLLDGPVHPTPSLLLWVMVGGYGREVQRKLPPSSRRDFTPPAPLSPPHSPGPTGGYISPSFSPTSTSSTPLTPHCSLPSVYFAAPPPMSSLPSRSSLP